MNQVAKCHQIEGCRGLYIDAFKAFKEKIQDESSTFILTHYHSDHYNGLHRGKTGYNGPALIHCTPVTAALLREIHGVESKYIIEHPYGITWTHQIPRRFNNDSALSSKRSNNGSEFIANITFYDANHCPGAAIVHVHIPHSNKHHVHTGDMRFNLQKFIRYPLIRKAVDQNNIDLLYLDTTYSKPKHDFMPQDEAIKMISSAVKDLLYRNNHLVEQKKKSFFQPKKKTGENEVELKRTLVLLSCYSIGKEKVLWNSAIESNQKVYVNKTKYKMLQCIQQESNDDNYMTDESCNIITKCTCNPHESDIHVIQMGTAGTLHPYFKPNFESCALYAHQLNKGYSKVVAFLPTGWANSSNFNKENSISTKRVSMESLKELLPPRTAQKGCYGNDSFIDVEVRLVPYSEHSSFSELRSCVKFFKPRQVIPTVFSNDKDYSEIENRFRDLVDIQRAKAAFINSISGGNVEVQENGRDNKRAALVRQESSSMKIAKKKRTTVSNTKVENCEDHNMSLSSKCIDIMDTEVDTEVDTKKESKLVVDDALVAILVSMGFDVSRSRQSLLTKDNNLDAAIEMLLGHQ